MWEPSAASKAKGTRNFTDAQNHRPKRTRALLTAQHQGQNTDAASEKGRLPEVIDDGREHGSFLPLILLDRGSGFFNVVQCESARINQM